MEPPIPPFFFALLLLLGMLILLETGRRLGIRRRPKESEGERSSQGAVFALFGLLMAFTFSGDMPFCSGWDLSVPCWLVIGCQAANIGVGSTFLGSRSSR